MVLKSHTNIGSKENVQGSCYTESTWLMTTATATEFQIPWGLDKSKARPQTVTEIIYYDDTCNFVVQSSQGQAGVNILPVPPVPGQRKWSLKLTQNGTIIIIMLLLLLPSINGLYSVVNKQSNHSYFILKWRTSLLWWLLFGWSSLIVSNRLEVSVKNH